MDIVSFRVGSKTLVDFGKPWVNELDELALLEVVLARILASIGEVEDTIEWII